MGASIAPCDAGANAVAAASSTLANGANFTFTTRLGSLDLLGDPAGAPPYRDLKAAAGDEVSVINMGGEGTESMDTRATEASVRGFWKAYRRHMGY